MSSLRGLSKLVLHFVKGSQNVNRVLSSFQRKVSVIGPTEQHDLYPAYTEHTYHAYKI